MAAKVPSRRLLRRLLALNRTSQPALQTTRTHDTRPLCPPGGRLSSRPSLSPLGSHPIRHSSTTANATSTAPHAHHGASSPSTSSNNDTTTPPPPPVPLPDITNHYTLFPSTLPHGPPPAPQARFHVPLEALRQEFLRTQAACHPDKHPAEPVRSKAAALSALVNTAYRTLADPLLRAQYLLQLTYGVDVTTEDNAAHPSDPETLMEILDAQERVEGAGAEDEVLGLKRDNDRRIEETVARLAAAFEWDDKDAAIKECVRLQFWRSLGDVLHAWEPGKEVRLVH